MVAAPVQVHAAVEEVRVLWIDDEPHFVKNYRGILEGEQYPVKFDIAKSLKEAARKVKRGRFDAVIVDCKMDKRDASANGAEFLLRLNQEHKYAHQQGYRRYLEQSYAIVIHSKIKEFELPLSKEPFFIEVVKRAQDYVPVKDAYPERVEFAKYVRDPAKYSAAIKGHWQKHGHWISVEMGRKNFVWCVVCGSEIVKGSKDIFEFPTELELHNMGETFNLVPFAYTEPLLPEDTLANVPDRMWSKTVYENDYYPTLCVKIGVNDLVGDFDSGAVQTIVSDQLIEPGILDSPRKRSAMHLGKPYVYFPKKVRLSITDADGSEQTQEIPVSVVEDWDNSPFTAVNQSRKTLFGRDILRAFQLEVSLDSKRRITRVRFL
jgi:CheY-like chemotaxis protein